MLYYDKVYLSERINIAITIKNTFFCCHSVFSPEFKFQNSVGNDGYVLKILCLNISDIVIITVKGVDNGCIIPGISKSVTTHL